MMHSPADSLNVIAHFHIISDFEHSNGLPVPKVDCMIGQTTHKSLQDYLLEFIHSIWEIILSYI